MVVTLGWMARGQAAAGGSLHECIGISSTKKIIYLLEKLCRIEKEETDFRNLCPSSVIRCTFAIFPGTLCPPKVY